MRGGRAGGDTHVRGRARQGQFYTTLAYTKAMASDEAVIGNITLCQQQTSALFVTLAIQSTPLMVWQGSMSQLLMGIMSYVQAWRLIFARCSTYLAHMHDLTYETPSVESVLVMCDFSDVFLADLLVVSLIWELDLAIEVESSTKPISIPSYRITPVEHKELNS